MVSTFLAYIFIREFNPLIFSVIIGKQGLPSANFATCFLFVLSNFVLGRREYIHIFFTILLVVLCIMSNILIYNNLVWINMHSFNSLQNLAPTWSHPHPCMLFLSQITSVWTMRSSQGQGQGGEGEEGLPWCASFIIWHQISTPHGVTHVHGKQPSAKKKAGWSQSCQRPQDWKP